MILPRYMTTTLSARARTSSSSEEMTRTGVPWSLTPTMRLWMNSMDPTSTPLVGWFATSRLSSLDISRATTTFCWLPPDRDEIGSDTSVRRMSYSCCFARALSSMTPSLSIGPFEKGASPNWSRTRLSAMEKEAMIPSVVRSSGMNPIPASREARGLVRVMSAPSRLIVPESGVCRPRTASASSVWPLPCTPATATISPRSTPKDRWSRTGTPEGDRSDTSSKTRPPPLGEAGAFSTFIMTERPTILFASSDSLDWGEAVPTTVPRRMTVMSSATARTSRSLWVMKTMDVPASANWRMMAMSSSVSCGVRTAVGSSRISTFASRDRALTISTRCWAPTGRSSISASGSRSNPKRADTSSTVLRAFAVSMRPALPTGSNPRAMDSATVKTGMSMKCWWTMPIPAATASPGPLKRTGSPSMRISPSSGSWRPYKTFMRVDLPAPFSPRSAWMWPSSIVRLMLLFATRGPNRLVIPLSSSFTPERPSLPH